MMRRLSRRRQPSSDAPPVAAKMQNIDALFFNDDDKSYFFEVHPHPALPHLPATCDPGPPLRRRRRRQRSRDKGHQWRGRCMIRVRA